MYKDYIKDDKLVKRLEKLHEQKYKLKELNITDVIAKKFVLI